MCVCVCVCVEEQLISTSKRRGEERMFFQSVIFVVVAFHDRVFAPKCASCNQPILPAQVRIIPDNSRDACWLTTCRE